LSQPKKLNNHKNLSAGDPSTCFSGKASAVIDQVNKCLDHLPTSFCGYSAFWVVTKALKKVLCRVFNYSNGDFSLQWKDATDGRPWIRSGSAWNADL
jgi:hypothetical protein